MRILKRLLERGYLTAGEVLLDDVQLSTEYELLLFVHQYTFVISEIKRAKNELIVRELSNIRIAIEGFFNTIIKLSEIVDGAYHVPQKILINNKKILDFINAFESFHKYKDIDYMKCLQSAMLTQAIYMKAHPENPIHKFVTG